MTENCGNCAFGVKHYLHHGYDTRCHRRSPIFKPEGDAYGRQTLWPIVKDDDFCGEWELTDARS